MFSFLAHWQVIDHGGEKERDGTGMYPVALRIHPIEIELALKTFPAVENPLPLAPAAAAVAARVFRVSVVRLVFLFMS